MNIRSLAFSLCLGILASSCVASRLPLPPEDSNDLGVLALSESRTDRAVAHFRRATTADPDNPLYWTNLGDALRENKKPDQARQAYLEALVHSPHHPRAVNNLADLAVDQGWGEDLDRILPDLKTATDLSGPWKPYLMDTLGRVLCALGEEMEARRAFRQAIMAADRPLKETATRHLETLESEGCPDRQGD